MARLNRRSSSLSDEVELEVIGGMHQMKGSIDINKNDGSQILVKPKMWFVGVTTQITGVVRTKPISDPSKVR
jgi:hypothetical protein